MLELLSVIDTWSVDRWPRACSAACSSLEEVLSHSKVLLLSIVQALAEESPHPVKFCDDMPVISELTNESPVSYQ